MDHNKLYLTTGEFAKLCHTTKHTLFHYCDIGLFTPAYTDENGYRYYHVLQYDVFLTINQLRTVGMSLSEIKNYMDERSPQRMVELYDQQELLISKQIAQLKQIKEKIHHQKTCIQQVLTHTEGYFLEQQDRCPLLCSDIVTEIDDYTMTTVIGELIHSSIGKTSSNTLGMTCKRKDAVCSETYPFQFYLYASPRKRVKGTEKPAGDYLTTYHHGPYETLCNSYCSLVSYANDHQIELDEQLYAETIIGDWAVRQHRDYVIKVSAKVKGHLLSKV